MRKLLTHTWKGTTVQEKTKHNPSRPAILVVSDLEPRVVMEPWEREAVSDVMFYILANLEPEDQDDEQAKG